MSEPGAVETYLRMLEGVGERADALVERPVASHWPFVGSDYRRLLVVGQALAGWDAENAPLWTPQEARTADGRRAILDATRAYARSGVNQ